MTGGLSEFSSRNVSNMLASQAVVLVNARAGTLLETGLATFQERVTRAFAGLGWAASVIAVEGDGLSDALRRAACDNPDLLVIAGGDGTVTGLLPVLREIDGRVGILPLGTWNLLARDLGFGQSIEDDIAALTSGRLHPVDLGLLNDVPFHSNVGLGFFATMARERERARRRFPFSRAASLFWAGLRSVLVSRAIRVEIKADGDERGVGREIVADAVLVTNNRFEGTPWHRPRLDEGLLEVHLLRAPGLASRLRCALAFARGTWRELPHLDSVVAREIEIRRPGRRVSRLAVDGEQRRLRGGLRFRIEARAISLVAAWPAGRETRPADAEQTGAGERDSAPGVILP